jgi:MoxR-like ATPase
MPRLLAAGWALEKAAPPEATVSAEALRALSGRVPEVDLGGVLEAYMEVVFKVRDLGIGFSDRRAVKVLKLLAASALLCGRSAANGSDLWVLRYVWDGEEQIEPLAALVNGILEQHAAEPARHALAAVQAAPDGEELARQLSTVEQEIGNGKLALAALARLRERVAELADQAAWLADAHQRQHLLDRARQTLDRLG